MTILSAFNYSDFIGMITKGEFLQLTTVSGVGRKTAERIAVELKDRIGKSAELTTAAVSTGFESLNKSSEVIQALIALGYNRMEADKMLKTVSSRDSFAKMTIEEIIKEVLSGK
jgi:Holliday junction DNA helicase RuvA